MRVYYVGGDRFLASAEAVLAAGHEIVAVRSAGPSHTAAKRFARRLGVPWHTGAISPVEYAGIRPGGVDLLACAGFLFRIPVDADPGLRAINVHPSLLPVGRGPDPFPRIILGAPEAAGVTVHEMSPKLDDGPILAQRGIEVTAADTAVTLALRAAALGGDLIREVLSDFERYWEARTPQTGGTYWKRLPRAAREVDWARPPIDVDRQLRAFAGVGALVPAWGRRIVVRPAGAWSAEHHCAPGTRVAESSGHILVAVPGGFVAVAAGSSPGRAEHLRSAVRWHWHRLSRRVHRRR